MWRLKGYNQKLVRFGNKNERSFYNVVCKETESKEVTGGYESIEIGVESGWGG